MSNYLIDTHCHLHDQEWFTPEQAEQFLQEAHQNNVQQIIVIGTDPSDSQVAQEFARQHKNVFWTYGIHPEHATKFQQPGALDPQNLPVVIGEIGLDYHYDGYDRAQQIHLFEQMLQLAADLSLPVSLHIREAFDDAWPVLDNFPDIKGVVHSFTGSKKDLKKALARDFCIGVNGLATYTTPPLPPLEKMLLETDAPFLTPVPFRGTINKPGYIRDIAAYLSEKLGVAEEIIAEQTTNNARQLLHLEEFKP